MVDFYFLQDGADFHIFEDRKCKEFNFIIKSPFKVADGDWRTAALARDWFVKKFPETHEGRLD